MERTAIMDCVALSKALDARLVSFRGENTGISSVSVDSRVIEQDALFTALIGASQDGHKFVEEAFKAGAGTVMVNAGHPQTHFFEEIARKFHGSLIIVDDTLKGLQEAAAYYLKKFPNLLKIGITGSSGKTTTKEIIAAMMKTEKNTIVSPGNLNSETGFPLAVFNIRPFHEAGVFELAMDKPGEIAALARILKPDIALITNIGSAHIEFFDDKQGIAEEKKAIFSQFTGKETALIPQNDYYRDFLAQNVDGRLIFYDTDITKLQNLRELDVEGFEMLWEGEPVRFYFPGNHNLQNLMAAAAIAREAGISTRGIRAGISSVKSLFGRTEILRGRITLIRDCYNANPESNAAALNMCDELAAGRRIYVIGSMLELGVRSDSAHAELGRRLAASSADIICLYGVETKPAITALENKKTFYHTNNIVELSDFLANTVKDGDTVLLKGSRGCALERLTEVLLPEGAA